MSYSGTNGSFSRTLKEYGCIMQTEEKNNNMEMDDEMVVRIPLIYELSKPGRRAYELPQLDVPKQDATKILGAKYMRKEKAMLPEIDTLGLVRHFTNLSRRNIGLDSSFYPLGSCTMKYNPKVNEVVAAMPKYLKVHPYQKDEHVQGTLQMLFEMQEYLKDIAGLDAVILAPAAGAHGELSSMMVIKAYHQSQGNSRNLVLIPDSAHGTNPASCAVCGYDVKTIKSSANGFLEIEDLKANLNDTVAALMITNPNTLGLFEEKIKEITELVHEAGALVYMDGANMNALLGIARPGDFGIDVMHYNLHKTFSTPHGGGGPGAGPIAVCSLLEDFLPGLIVTKDEDGIYRTVSMPESIGQTRMYFGSIGVILKAYAYIRRMGKEGLGQVGKIAVLNANYIMNKLKDVYHLPYDRVCMHECIFSADEFKKNTQVRTLDIAKRLLDYEIHPPTVYFPLIVSEAIMIEPTETENKETIDKFIEVMKSIATEAQEEPWKVQEAPYMTPVTRLDEVKAAREPILKYTPNLKK